MAYKAGLEQWDLGTKAFIGKNYENALEIFCEMPPNSKVHFNIGVIYFALADYESAINSFTKALNLDQYSSISYFQRGVSYMHILEHESAFEDFNDAILYLRGNKFIDYTQLGLEFRIHASEILYNRALCLFLLGSEAEGMNDLLAASKDKELSIMTQINTAMEQKGRDCPIFSLPDNCLFKPSESMLKNSKKVDYLGQAKVIASNTQTNLMANKFNKKFPTSKPKQEESLAAFLPARKNTSASTSQKIQVMRSMSFDPSLKPKSQNESRSGINSNTAEPPLRPQISRKYSNVQNPNSYTNTTPVSTNKDSYFGNSNYLNFNDKPQQTAFSRDFATSSSNQVSNMSSGKSLSRPSYTNFNDKSHFTVSTGDFENGASQTSTMSSRLRSSIPNNKMKVKCHYNDTRTILVDKNINFEQLIEKIKFKYEIKGSLLLKYKDEDGELVLLTDQEDLEMALSFLCNNSEYGEQSHLDPSSGFDGRFEVWCFTD